MILLFVTKNVHKVLEAKTSINLLGLGKYIDIKPINLPKLEIQSDDLRQIALFAAKYAYERSTKEYPIIVEDSGLYIESLNGFPGPYSSYAYRTIGIKGILKLMENVENRRATFVTVIALIHPELGEKIFEGHAEGIISKEPRGSRGFGFDPIFIPQGHNKTFAEMNIEEKCKYSHRGAAFRNMALWLASNLLALDTFSSNER